MDLTEQECQTQGSWTKYSLWKSPNQEKKSIKYTKIDWCTILMYLILGLNMVKVIQPKAVSGY